MSFVNEFDLAMVLVLAFFTVKGAFRGFFRELFSVVGLIAGVYFGIRYAGIVDGFLSANLTFLSPSLSRGASIALVFFAVCVVCSLLGSLFCKILSMVSLGALDRMFGLLAGACKGAAVVVIVVMVLNRAQSFISRSFLEQSRVVNIVNAYLPDVERYIDEVFPKPSEIDDSDTVQSDSW